MTYGLKMLLVPPIIIQMDYGNLTYVVLKSSSLTHPQITSKIHGTLKLILMEL